MKKSGITKYNSKSFINGNRKQKLHLQSNNLKLLESSVSRLDYSEFSKGITNTSSQEEKFNNNLGLLSNLQPKVVLKKLSEDLLTSLPSVKFNMDKKNVFSSLPGAKAEFQNKVKINSLFSNSKAVKSSLHSKLRYNNKINVDSLRNCSDSGRKSLNNIITDETFSNGHDKPVNYNVSSGNLFKKRNFKSHSVEKKIFPANPNLVTDDESNKLICPGKTCEKYFNGKCKFNSSTSIGRNLRETIATESECKSIVPTCKDGERKGVLSNKSLTAEKRTNVEILPVSLKSCDNFCQHGIRKLTYNDKMFEIQKNRIKQYSPNIFRRMRKDLHNNKRQFSLCARDSIGRRFHETRIDGRCSKKFFVDGCESKVIKNNEGCKRNSNIFHQKNHPCMFNKGVNPVCEDNDVSDHVYLRCDSSCDYAIKRKFIQEIRKDCKNNVSKCCCDTDCDGQERNELAGKIINVLQPNFKQVEIPLFSNSDEFSIHLMYKALQVGCVRSNGFLKDIIPSLKNGAKEDAIQFSCRTCMNTFSYYDVKNTFCAEDLRCRCPNNCYSGLHQMISAEFYFKFVVKDLRNTFFTYLLVGKEAEAFFGCSVNKFWHSNRTRHLVRRAIRNLLRSYDRKILSEFCLSTKNLFGSGPKYLVNTNKKYCLAPITKIKS